MESNAMKGMRKSRAAHSFLLLKSCGIAALACSGVAHAQYTDDSWTGIGGSTIPYWDKLENWSSGFPGSTSIVSIGSSFIPEFRQGSVTVASLQDEGGLVLSGGSLGVSNISFIQGSLTVSGGALGGAGEMTIGGDATLTAGAIGSGNGTTNFTNTLSISGDGAKTFGTGTINSFGTTTWGGNTMAGGNGLGTGDFNGDGKTDLIWRQASTGATVMWLMNGAAILQSYDLGGSADWSVTGTGDFNGDGVTDLLWRQASTGETMIWLMDGTSLPDRLAAYNLGGSADWSVTLTGDFNGDGFADLLWRQASTGQTVIWLMNGASLPNLVGSLDVGDSTDWSAIGTGDFNGEAKGGTDLLWRQASTGSTVLWLPNGSSSSPTIKPAFVGNP
jgi:hypothetical protein